MEKDLIKYRDIMIEDLFIDSAPLDKIEITIVTNKVILKNIYLPYIPLLHNKLFSRNARLKDKMEVFLEDVLRNLDLYLKQKTQNF